VLDALGGCKFMGVLLSAEATQKCILNDLGRTKVVYGNSKSRSRTPQSNHVASITP